MKSDLFGLLGASCTWMSICVPRFGESESFNLLPLVTPSLDLCHVGSARLSKQSPHLVLPSGQTALDRAISACGWSAVTLPGAGGLAVRVCCGYGGCPGCAPVEDRWTGPLLAPSTGRAAGWALELPGHSGFWSGFLAGALSQILCPVGQQDACAQSGSAVPGGP